MWKISSFSFFICKVNDFRKDVSVIFKIVFPLWNFIFVVLGSVYDWKLMKIEFSGHSLEWSFQDPGINPSNVFT